MAVSVLGVARTLGRISDWRLSNLELQKIAYIAEMLYLGRHDDPLITGDWQAWANGPVEPSLYHAVKMFGTDRVKDIYRVAFLTDANQLDATNDAYEMLKDLNPGEMVGLTHRRNGAWARFYKSGSRGTIIPKSDIKNEYSTLINDK